MSESNVLLKVENVKKWFPVRRGIFSKVTEYVKAVDGVSLEVHAGHTLGIVGESGCGKSTLARVIMGLIPPTEGTVYFEGQDMTHADRATIHRMRRDIQIIFQDPYASLNPRQRVSSILTEPYKIHHLGTQQQAMDRARELLDLVGLPQDSMRKFPHEFSGGQRQRVAIARALINNPAIVMAVYFSTGCIHPGANHQPADPSAKTAGHRADLCFPRSAGGGAHFLPRGRDVFRPDGGVCR